LEYYPTGATIRLIVRYLKTIRRNTMKDKEHGFEQEAQKKEAYEAPKISCLPGGETETGGISAPIEAGSYHPTS